MGNIDNEEAEAVGDVITKRFLEPSVPLKESENPRFRSMMLPTKVEAEQLFGKDGCTKEFSTVYQELAASESEENNAVEVTLQFGSETSLGFEGPCAILNLPCSC